MDNHTFRDWEMILEIVWLIFVALDTVPLAAYIIYMRHVSEKKSWNIDIDPSYEPNVSIIIPTHNEAGTIERKLDNILEVDYPKDKIEMIIVDSASNDGTLQKVQMWAAKHSDVKMELLGEDRRSGMVKALNIGLKKATGDIIVKTDADCLWFTDSLKKAIKYMGDSTVGSVAGLHSISAHRETGVVRVERTYRRFYKWLRIGESKLYSTVLYEGELMLVKRSLLKEIGSFDEELGADDVPTALRVTERGYRAITAEDAYFLELTPYTWRERFKQKVRRGRHVLQALWKYKYLNFKRKTSFSSLVLPMETYIYIINPLLMVPAVILSIPIIARYPWLLLITLLLFFGSVRELVSTHLTDVTIMLVAMLREIGGRERVTWQKIEEIR